MVAPTPASRLRDRLSLYAQHEHARNLIRDMLRWIERQPGEDPKQEALVDRARLMLGDWRDG